MSGRLELPPLPEGIRALTNSESEHVRREDARRWPSPAKCQTCMATGSFRWYAPQSRTEVVEYNCRCEDQWELYRYFLHAGIGLGYQRLGWPDVSLSADKFAGVLRWMDNCDVLIRAGQGMLLRGQQGTGKTLLSTLALKGALARGHDGYQTTFYGLLTMLMEGWQSKADRSHFDARVRHAEVLVVDDVGKEQQQKSYQKGEGSTEVRTQTAKFAIESVLRDRLAAGLPTILTTNLSLEDISVHYGSGFGSLLTEAAEVIDFHGADYRPVHRSTAQQEALDGLSRPVVVE